MAGGVAFGAGEARWSRALAQFTQMHDRVLINGVQCIQEARGLVVERDPILVGQDVLGACARRSPEEVVQRPADCRCCGTVKLAVIVSEAKLRSLGPRFACSWTADQARLGLLLAG